MSQRITRKYGEEKQSESSTMTKNPRFYGALLFAALLIMGAYCYYNHEETPKVLPEIEDDKKKKKKLASTPQSQYANIDQLIEAFIQRFQNENITCCGVKEFYETIQAHPEWGIDTSNPNTPSSKALAEKLTPIVLQRWGLWKGKALRDLCQSFFENGAKCDSKTCHRLKQLQQTQRGEGGASVQKPATVKKSILSSWFG